MGKLIFSNIPHTTRVASQQITCLYHYISLSSPVLLLSASIEYLRSPHSPISIPYLFFLNETICSLACSQKTPASDSGLSFQSRSCVFFVTISPLVWHCPHFSNAFPPSEISYKFPYCSEAHKSKEVTTQIGAGKTCSSDNNNSSSSPVRGLLTTARFSRLGPSQ